MHKKWQDLIPYYVARTLPRAREVALEKHLAGCVTCRHAVEEWQRVAGIVQHDAQTWARQAVPLDPQIRARLDAPYAASMNGHKRPARFDPDATVINWRSQWQRGGRPSRVPVTLAAVVLVVIFAGVLLAYLAARNDNSDRLSPPTGSPTPATVTPRPPSQTPLPTVTVNPVSGSSGGTPASPTPVLDLGILPVGTPASRTPPPTSTAQPVPPAGICSLRSASGARLTVYTQPRGTTLTTLTADEFRRVLSYDSSGWFEVDLAGGAVGWVRAVDVQIYGTCAGVGAATSIATVPTLPPPTPTSLFSQYMGGYFLVTLEQVGTIPAGTRVALGSQWYDGQTWWYAITTQDGRSADARASQLAYAPDMDFGPTPTFAFSGASGYVLITLTQVGDIPAGASVRVSHSWYDGTTWIYYIVAQDTQREAEARQDQLAYAPDVTPGPTPTAVWGSYIGSGQYPLVTLVQVGDIPAGTRVRVSSAYFDGRAWHYTIVNQTELAVAEALQNQIGPAPGPTPTAVWGSYIGSGQYPLVTLVQVGDIPAGTRVRVSSAYFDGRAWHYTIVNQTELVVAEALQNQIGPAPGPTPTMTPTPSLTALPDGMTIQSFTVEPNPVVAGQNVTLHWTVSGAQSVRLLDYNAIAPPYSTVLKDELPASSSYSFVLPVPGSYSYSDSRAYQLVAVDANGRVLEGSSTNGGIVVAPLACPFTYFFGSVPESCPTAPASTQQINYQPFEHGFMLRLNQTGYVLVDVVFEDGTWEQVQASGTQPDVLETPPDGLVQPTGALGQAWQLEGVRDRLGWATAPEQTYPAQTQSEARSGPTTKSPFKTYWSLPDGRALRLDPFASTDAYGRLYGGWAFVG